MTSEGGLRPTLLTVTTLNSYFLPVLSPSAFPDGNLLGLKIFYQRINYISLFVPQGFSIPESVGFGPFFIGISAFPELDNVTGDIGAAILEKIYNSSMIVDRFTYYQKLNQPSEELSISRWP